MTEPLHILVTSNAVYLMRKATFKDSIVLRQRVLTTGVISSRSEDFIEAIDVSTERLILKKKIVLTITHTFLSSFYKNATYHQ